MPMVYLTRVIAETTTSTNHNVATRSRVRDHPGMTHLTHGWEPDLDASDSLLRRYVLATADRGEAMARAIGGRARRTEVYSAADPASPVMFDNAVVVLQPPSYADLDIALPEALAWYPPERHVVVLSPFPTSDLAALGLSLMGHPPLMYRPAGGAGPAVPDGLTVHEVADEADLAEFVQTLVEAYPMPGGDSSGIADLRVLDGTIRLFIGRVDGATVATSGARIGHGVNDVEWVSTRSGHRRRGIGEAMTWAATLAAPELPAVLVASDDGQRMYESMGFVRLLRLTMWHRPPTV
jgi:GNAT superfamily N-acetyltransferase